MDNSYPVVTSPTLSHSASLSAIIMNMPLFWWSSSAATHLYFGSHCSKNMTLYKNFQQYDKIQLTCMHQALYLHYHSSNRQWNITWISEYSICGITCLHTTHQTERYSKLRIMTRWNQQTFRRKTTTLQWKKRILKDYHEFIDILNSKLINSLPTCRQYNAKIKLKEGTELCFAHLYGMSQEKRIVLNEYVEHNVQKWWFRVSSFLAGSPIRFMKKTDGSLQLSFDYRSLNTITVKNRYPLPPISETLDRLSKAK